jgi:hypothetical protein
MANPDDLPRLAAAFAASRYRVPALGAIGRLHVRVAAPVMEPVLPARRYAFLTAWDSDSQRDTRIDNDRADGELVAELERLRVTHLRAQAQDDEGRHQEDGWLVCDLPLDALDELARRFAQDGVLAWAAGEPVRLRLYHPAPDDDAARMPFIDWVG